ncbi:AcrB/AcrD/AcrF family protein [Sphingomonas profundi]|uniref:AcrB/AcrD/AcrF family protein n=1 Tax=Alterirhizorhabdus profundi TaxID=2681549 RepID=UPI0012E89A88|nr:AcrB/AcrD/AcrF family protein [Sphingomonas profundi]
MASFPEHPVNPSANPFARHWVRWTLLLWLAAAIAMIVTKWAAIHWFALGDTDDNLRIAQVNAWLHGQGWYDLRQYRLNPPAGADIHWSRLADLPIAGIILLVKPFAGYVVAEKAAVAIAPLIPLALAMLSLALAARRLVAPGAFAFGALLLLCGQSALFMFMPLRIDHHGWQLAFLALALAGSADAARRRGGAIVGLATALSLIVGLEMLPYLALAGGVIALRWVADRAERDRLAAYAATLAGGSAIGFLLFASTANRAPVCDALSPVWLSASLAAGGLLAALAWTSPTKRRVRLALAVVAAVVLVAAFAYAWPHCLSRPEGVSPELERLWLSHVREAKPIYQHGWRVYLPALALPLAGAIGAAAMLWRGRGTPAFAAWATPTLLAIAACAMLLWQTRAGPAAQLLGVPGAAALGWLLLPRIAGDRRPWVRLGGAIALFLVVSGVAVPLTINALPPASPGKGRRATAAANRKCPTLPALAPIARLPQATILTFVDFGPRLLAVTHHRAIAGPYHRNGAAILDVQHAFRGSAENARRIMWRHGATLLLICPGMSESTIYAGEARNGFYAQLMRGRVPGWLAPVPLPKSNPLRLWRLAG